MTVGELEQRMSSAELTEWQAFYMLQQKAINPKAGMSEQQSEFYEAFGG